jgi:hypothetical protein
MMWLYYSQVFQQLHLTSINSTLSTLTQWPTSVNSPLWQLTTSRAILLSKTALHSRLTTTVRDYRQNAGRNHNIRLKKLKLSHYTPWRRLGKKRCSSYSFLTSALDWGEWSATRPDRALAPRERTTGTHCAGGWVGVWACLDTGYRKTPFASAGDRTSIARSSSPWSDTVLTELPGSRIV